MLQDDGCLAIDIVMASGLQEIGSSFLLFESLLPPCVSKLLEIFVDDIRGEDD